MLTSPLAPFCFNGKSVAIRGAFPGRPGCERHNFAFTTMYCWILKRPNPPHLPILGSLSSSIIKRNARAPGVQAFAAISLLTVYFLYFNSFQRHSPSPSASNSLLFRPIPWPHTRPLIHTPTYVAPHIHCCLRFLHFTFECYWLNLQSTRNYHYLHSGTVLPLHLIHLYFIYKL